MTLARAHLESAEPAAALALGQALWRSVTPERPVLLYGATLEGEALVLGAYQHAPHALAAAAAADTPVLRRRSGGASVRVTPGVGYLALGLLDRSALMSCPAGKLLNRNVRGCLAGLRRLKLPAHYFGRDWVSVETRPAAYLAWSEAADGRALVELFVGVHERFSLPPGVDGYPERDEPPYRGKEPITLEEAGYRGDVRQALEALRDGYAQAHQLELAQGAPSDEERADARVLAARIAAAPAQAGLQWGRPRQEAIGFISAGARLDDDGALAGLHVGGDLMQHEDCPGSLAGALLGHEPSAHAIGAALDATYAARPGLIEGVRDLGTLQRALLDAVECAREPDVEG